MACHSKERQTDNENDFELCAAEVRVPERMRAEIAQKATESQLCWCFGFRCYLPTKESIFQKMGKRLRRWRGRIWFSMVAPWIKEPHLQLLDLLHRQCLLLILLKGLFSHNALIFLSLRKANSTILLQTEPTGLSVTVRGECCLLCCTLWSETVICTSWIHIYQKVLLSH